MHIVEVTISTVPPPRYSGGWRRRLARADQRPSASGAYILCAEGPQSRDARVVVGSHVHLAVGRKLGGVDRMSAPAAWALRARRWMGWMKPLTFDAPLIVTRATRPAYFASCRSKSSSSSRPSGRA
jgi:hypothetical protein